MPSATDGCKHHVVYCELNSWFSGKTALLSHLSSTVFFLLLFYICFVCTYVHHMCAWFCLWRSEDRSDSLERDLGMVVSNPPSPQHIHKYTNNRDKNEESSLKGRGRQYPPRVGPHPRVSCDLGQGQPI